MIRYKANKPAIKKRISLFVIAPMRINRPDKSNNRSVVTLDSVSVIFCHMTAPPVQK
jgi:hypothetical protein